MAADLTTAVLAGAATLVFQGVAGIVKLTLSRSREKRDSVRKLLALFTLVEWHFANDRWESRYANAPDFSQTHKRLGDFLVAIGEARAVLSDKQIDAALAVHLGFDMETDPDEGAEGANVGVLTLEFLAALGAKSTAGIKLRAVGAKYLAESKSESEMS